MTDHGAMVPAVCLATGTGEFANSPMLSGCVGTACIHKSPEMR